MRLLFALTTLLLLSSESFANNRERLQEANFAATHQLEQSSLERKNQSVLTYLWADVYAAAFYAPTEASASQAVSKPLTQRLELYYFRNIDSQDVIKAAWVTLERQHDAATLQRLRPEVDALHATFRDIRPGDRYALNFNQDSGLTLEVNGKVAYTSQNPALAKAYLGIWLSPNGLSDKLRTSLLAD
ncbi:chalcone isomerase family protein [Pseudomonas anguilliseptica]|uniref:Chalcone isomerase-like n=1 Tax=Pseudomonas anguilliseptica TaxID=53406 RepID=A0A1H5IJ52_PSEAG|nr:chalcone isomerase family protein [Pseudomonas anguilliseptica]MCZ4323527.1 chalcone isomerase family protein [Pseudomonas anguilliseptica]SEE40239.1 Chalcone isomerase-like [Pseudomonas anguilliseptica]